MTLVFGNLLFLPKPNQVHVWLFDLGNPSQELLDWEWILSEQEIIRSKRYRFERDRLRFVARRGILRMLLGKYLGLAPVEIAYHTNPYGKLSLPSHPLQFNLSSCQNRVIFAFTLEKKIGVDLERIHSFPELDRMAEHWFSAAERASLFALAPELQIEAFFHIWTQKEAFLKAHGKGLSLPLQNFSVSVDPNLPGGLLSIEQGEENITSWKMCTYTLEAWLAGCSVCRDRDRC